MKGCGSCTLCCLLTEVPELNKPVNKWCKFCIGNKCKIYGERPNSCRSFQCLWLKDEGLSKALRPDKCGVLFEPFTELTYLALVDPNHHEAWQEENVMNLVLSLLEKGHAVIVSSNKKHIMLPIGKTTKDIYDDIGNRLMEILS